MTYKEFKRQVFAIYSQTYHGEDVSPIEYGIRRAEFEEKKLQRLISLADLTSFSTAKRKVAGWKRQLERVQLIRMRLEERRKEAPVTAAFCDSVPRKLSMPLPGPRSTQPVRLQ